MSDLMRGAHPDPELLTALADGELDPAARDAVLSHVASCADCRPVLEAERQLKTTLRALPGADRATGSGDGALGPSVELLARLRAVPSNAARDSTAPDVSAAAPPQVASLEQHRARRPGRAPTYLGAAASVAVFLVGAFAFLGATGAAGPSTSPSEPAGGVAIVPAADRMTLEHAATNAQTSLGGPGITTVSVSVPATSASADAR